MLDFLAQATVADVAENNVARKGGPRKQRNPEGLAIRIFKDGSLYPSAALVGKFGLEYSSQGADDQGFGFDVVDTALYPAFKVGKRIIIITPVSRDAKGGKLDLFASVGYDEAGKPLNSVLEQGSKTFGKNDLLPLIEDVYGITTEDFIDLMFVANPVTGEAWGLPAGKEVTFLPKKVSRGDAKGQITTIRREKPSFYALIPSSLIEGSKSAGTQSNDNESTELTSSKVEDYQAVAEDAEA